MHERIVIIRRLNADKAMTELRTYRITAHYLQIQEISP